MRPTLIFLILMALCSCVQRSDQTTSNKDHDSSKIVNKTITTKANEKFENDPAELTMLEWEQHEDSIRNAILRKKENKVLAKSFLQEMYIRNVVNVERDSLFFNIPFDLHGPDCGAPDCYSTDISFSFKFGDTLIFPKTVQFREHEHGCVDKERKLSGSFQLVEETGKHVIYHSPKHKRTLVLFGSYKENGTMAYYFSGVEQNRINGQNLYNIIKDYNEEEKNTIYPFTSWVLTTGEYENFMQ